MPLTGAVVDRDYPWASITLGYDGRRWWSTWRHGCLDGLADPEPPRLLRNPNWVGGDA
jgi:hypothetical protein